MNKVLIYPYLNFQERRRHQRAKSKLRCSTVSNVKNNSVGTFFILTFCISWAFWLPMIIMGSDDIFLRVAGTYGPLIAAFLLTGFREGRNGFKKLLKPFFIWKTGLFWYFFCFLSTAVLGLSAIGIYSTLGRNQLVFNDPKKFYLVVPIFIYVLVFSVLGEETGWRGFALPRLQKRFGALKTSVLIGFIWGFWHLPLFFIEGNFHQEIPLWLFILQDVALSVVISWIYNHTAGSLLLIHLFHGASNTTLGVLPLLPMDTGGDILPLYMAFAFLVILALGIIVTGNLEKPRDRSTGENVCRQNGFL